MVGWPLCTPTQFTQKAEADFMMGGQLKDIGT